MNDFQKIKSVIVEDESAAREALKNYLAKYCPQIEIIGEAIKLVSKGLHSSYPEVPWEDIAGMRDKLIHDYRNEMHMFRTLDLLR